LSKSCLKVVLMHVSSSLLDNILLGTVIQYIIFINNSYYINCKQEYNKVVSYNNPYEKITEI